MAKKAKGIKKTISITDLGNSNALSMISDGSSVASL